MTVCGWWTSDVCVSGGRVVFFHRMWHETPPPLNRHAVTRRSQIQKFSHCSRLGLLRDFSYIFSRNHQVSICHKLSLVDSSVRVFNFAGFGVMGQGFSPFCAMLSNVQGWCAMCDVLLRHCRCSLYRAFYICVKRLEVPSNASTRLCPLYKTFYCNKESCGDEMQFLCRLVFCWNSKRPRVPTLVMWMKY